MSAFFRKWFWFGCGAVGLGALLLALLTSGWLGFRLFQLEWTPQGQTELRFEEAALPFENTTDVTDLTGSLPFMAGVVIDVDGDGADEVFLGGGGNQADGLFAFDQTTTSFRNVSAQHALQKSENDATMGGASVDVDRDGRVDLIVARESGLWLYRNQDGRLVGERLAIEFDPSTTLLSIAPGDVNGDGAVDLYVSGYIRNALVEGQTIFSRPYGGYSYLLINDGTGEFRDASEEYGVWRQHNTFTAVFADIDNDRDPDLVIAQDTGMVETYRNDGTAPFARIDNPSVNSYPMGLAAGDFTGDGAIDFYFSNVGHTLPEALLRGDLAPEAPFNTDYMLLRNDADGGFTDVARDMHAARLGFGWGVVAGDFNLDGWEDIAVAQNYAKFGQPAIIHRYAGRILQNEAGRRFRPVEKRAGASNPLFAISPLIGDFNGDHLPDLVWANLRGPSRAFINVTPNRNWIAIRLDDSASAYNARVEVVSGDRTLVRQVVPAQGLSSDQTATLMIGLAEAVSAESVRITFRDGEIRDAADVAAGSVIDWRRDPR